MLIGFHHDYQGNREKRHVRLYRAQHIVVVEDQVGWVQPVDHPTLAVFDSSGRNH